MVQAARSGRQNIAEGSRAGATSSKTETHLTNVARSSLDELLLDYEDYLRQRKLRQWSKDDPEAQKVRSFGRKSDRSDLTDPTDAGDLVRWALYAPWLEHKDPAIIANTLICLIHQANYLMDQQIIALEQAFIKEGGYSEQLAVARLAERERLRKNPINPSDPTDPTDLTKNCPLCAKLMAIRTARQGKNTGSQFWGCTGYPTCKGTRPM
jgi:four helix bundle suffix protein